VKITELIQFGLSQEVKPEHVEILRKVLEQEEYKQTTRGALFFLGEDAVTETLPLDCRMFWGKVALELGN